jgi:hypothetical protein
VIDEDEELFGMYQTTDWTVTIEISTPKSMRVAATFVSA